jgi:hypothetical protein
LNYVDENSEIIWDTDLLQGFNNDVAAIYRNDSLDINQKQSCGNGGLAEISFYIDNLEEDNNLNNSFIQNKEYLFFGHNNDSLKTSNNDSLDASLHVFDLLQRRWMVKANGDSLKNTNINIKFNVSQLDSFDNISLVINRQANNEFLINNCDFYLPDSVDNDNNYYFTNIKWDTDSSGFDMFTFQLSSQSLFSQNFDPGNNNAQNNSLENEIEVELYPNPTDKKFKIHFKTANFNNYTLEIFDVNGRLIEKEEIDISNHHFLYREIKTKGLYYITIYNNQESVTKKIIIN